MATVTNKPELFEDDGVSNTKVILDGKLTHWEDLERELKKEVERINPD